MSEKRERELNLETNQISQSTENIKGSKVENLKVNTAYNITNRLLSVGSVYLIIFRSVFLIFGLFNCIIIILLLYSTS
jgi:hypothetical protein